jgi:GTPase SAR1 family protein
MSTQQKRDNFMHSYVLVYDVTQKESFDLLEQLRVSLVQHDENALIFVMGNKIDLSINNRCV